MLNINQEIKNYLDANGIKQRFLANKAGLSEKTLSYILTGRSRLTTEVYQKICNALDLPLDYFWRKKIV